MEIISYIALGVALIAIGLGLIFPSEFTIIIGITGVAIVIVFFIDYTHEQKQILKNETNEIKTIR